MSLEHALHEIKSHQFAARLNVVSSMPAFFTAASREPAVLSLYKDMGESGEAREEVLGQIQDLSQLEIDRRYENPNDTTLAVLLWLTEYAAHDFSPMAADLVDRAPQCWYAKKLARRILMPPKVGTGHFQVGEHPIGARFDSGGSGDTVITLNPAAGLKRPRYYTSAKISGSDTPTFSISETQNLAA
jgi:hypothetical protein